MKSIERVFHPKGIKTIRFVINKINLKKFDSMSDGEKKDAISFLKDCKDDVDRFIDDVEALNNKTVSGK